MTHLQALIDRQAVTDLVTQLSVAVDERDGAAARQGRMTSLGESTAVELGPA